MRTTISLSDELYAEAKALAGPRPFSEFASEAIDARIAQLKREHLAREMAEGYRFEAESPSLPGEWTAVEAEGL
jgi:hypothetical protein